MFVFSAKAKRFSLILMAVGVISLILNFTMSEGVSHEDVTHITSHEEHSQAVVGEHATGHSEDQHASNDHHETSSHDVGHDNHHQLVNKPWSRLFVNIFFFMAISLGALFFLSIQYAAQVGWSVVVLRIMEAMSQFLIIPVLLIIGLSILGVFHVHHLWHWMAEGIMDPESPAYDSIIAGKQGYLSAGFFITRSVVYLLIWVLGAKLFRKYSLQADTGSKEEGAALWSKKRTLSAVFLVLFAVSSSMMAWDWIMSIDTHWFSTLFGWYTFAGLFVSALTVITLIAIYLKMNGYLPELNHSHLQDLGKFMFAFSVFWTYLWFSQYMLIWYSNIPEEVTYYLIRFKEYKGPFMTALALNFLFPILVMMSRDSKRNMYFVITAGIAILAGHWLDHFVMIMPGTVGVEWSIGLIDLGIFCGFMGLFIWVVFSSIAKAALVPKNHPMLTESKLHHI